MSGDKRRGSSKAPGPSPDASSESPTTYTTVLVTGCIAREDARYQVLSVMRRDVERLGHVRFKVGCYEGIEKSAREAAWSLQREFGERVEPKVVQGLWRLHYQPGIRRTKSGKLVANRPKSIQDIRGLRGSQLTDGVDFAVVFGGRQMPHATIAWIRRRAIRVRDGDRR